MRKLAVFRLVWRLWDSVAYRVVHLLGGRFLSDEESQLLKDAHTWAEFLGSMCKMTAVTITRRDDLEWGIQVALQWRDYKNNSGGTTKAAPAVITTIGSRAVWLFNRCKNKRKLAENAPTPDTSTL